MYQTIGTIDVDKGAEFSQAGHPAGLDVTIMQLIQQAVLDGFTRFLQG